MIWSGIVMIKGSVVCHGELVEPLAVRPLRTGLRQAQTDSYWSKFSIA
jgi:hypothetical protein